MNRIDVRGLCLAAFGLAFAAGLAGVARADQGLIDRMGALLGAERETLQIVPAARLAALTVLPSVAEPARPGPDASDIAALPEGAAAAQPTPAAEATGDAQWRCLTEALYFEARGESERGMFAVTEVILNRVDSPSYPGTVCGVVHQGTGGLYACQFTYTCDGLSDTIRDRAAWITVGRIARAALDGAPRTLTGGATHYHTHAVSPSWARRFPQTAVIGAHLFYRQPTRIASN